MTAAQTLLGKGDLDGAKAVLERAAEETQDGAVGQLLRQTQEQAAEAARRVEAVRGRLGSLGESDPAQALALLAEQPETVQRHADLRELRTKLEERQEQDRAVRAAVARADGQLAAGKLREGQETLETVRRAFGSFAAIEMAQAAYAARLLPAANGLLQAAMAEARRHLLAGEASAALAAVQGASGAVAFAAPAMAADWRRLAEETEKAAGVQPGPSGPLPGAVQGSKGSVKLLGGIAAVLLLTVIAVLLLRPKPVVPQSFLQLNASPFAEVVSLTAAQGAAVPLPPGDHTTPLRLEGVPQGEYTVVFREANGAQRQLACSVSEASHLCALPGTPLSDADVDAVIAGSKP